MRPERSQRVEQLYHEARNRDPSERAAFLEEMCASDEALRHDVESLLAEDSGVRSFLETPALEFVQKLPGEDTSPSLVGRQLGAYCIVSFLARGGMGEVYRGRDTKLKREVAIKILPEQFSLDAERLARFQREAQVLAALNHPNIAQIYGLEAAGTLRCIVMELVEGETLEERLKRGPIPVEQVLTIAGQIAEALEAAHEKDIIHRDLKPANVQITPEGRVKVLDFGLAKPLSEPNQDFSMTATDAGVILGTAAYMSPEQAKGLKVDQRTDIFSFGAVLYEMLTGKPAFNGDSVSDILAAVLRIEPDWTRLPKDTATAIRRLLRRCLQKDRNRRLQTAIDIQIELEDAKNEPETDVSVIPSAARRSRERLAWISALIFVSLIAATLVIPTVVRFRQTVPNTPTIRATILPPENTSLDFTNGLGLPALSPDGTRIVFGARTAGGTRPLWVRAVDGLMEQPLAGTDGALFPFWSPDSRFIAFFANGKLKKIDASGGPVQTVTEAAGGHGGTWNRDGVIVFAPTQNPGLMQVSAAGGSAKTVTSVFGSFPWFLPDGQHLLYQEQAGSSIGEGRFRVGSLDGWQSKVLGAGSNVLYSQGHLLFLHEGTLMAQPFDTEHLVTKGEAVPIAEHVQTVLPSGRVGVFSVSETGLLIYRAGAGQRTQLTWLDRIGKMTATLGNPDENLVGFPELSPDGRRAVVDRNVQGNEDIWLIDLSREGATRFTFDASPDRFPLWSPDGAQIVFSSRRKNARDLYTKPSSGSGTEQLLLESPNLKIAYSWSADNHFLLYSEDDPKTARDLWALPMRGNRKPIAVVHSPFNESNGQFSPDGRWVAYHSNESGRYEIYVVPFPPGAGKWQVSTGGGVAPRWRHDGKELYYIGPNGQMMAANVSPSGTSFEVASPMSLFQGRIVGGGTATPNKHQYAVSADGRFLINVPTGDATASPITLLSNWKPPAK